MKKIGMSITFFLVLILFVSCSMFTTTLGVSRNASKTFGQTTAQELVDLLNSNQALSSEDSKAISNALAGKSSEDLNLLSTEDKGKIINTVAAGILPSPVDLLNLVDIDNLIEMDGDDVDAFMDSIMNDAIDLIDENVLLDAVEVFFNNDDTVVALIEGSPDALLMGTLALTASIAKKNDVLSSLLEGESMTLDGLFEDTFTLLGNHFYTGKGDVVTFLEEQELSKTLANSMNTNPEEVSALLNVAVELYIYSDNYGLASLGGLEGIFSDFLGAEVE